MAIELFPYTSQIVLQDHWIKSDTQGLIMSTPTFARRLVISILYWVRHQASPFFYINHAYVCTQNINVYNI